MQNQGTKICCNCYAAGNKYIGMCHVACKGDCSIISRNRMQLYHVSLESRIKDSVYIYASSLEEAETIVDEHKANLCRDDAYYSEVIYEDTKEVLE